MSRKYAFTYNKVHALEKFGIERSIDTKNAYEILYTVNNNILMLLTTLIYMYLINVNIAPLAINEYADRFYFHFSF